MVGSPSKSTGGTPVGVLGCVKNHCSILLFKYTLTLVFVIALVGRGESINVELGQTVQGRLGSHEPQQLGIFSKQLWPKESYVHGIFSNSRQRYLFETGVGVVEHDLLDTRTPGLPYFGFLGLLEAAWFLPRGGDLAPELGSHVLGFDLRPPVVLPVNRGAALIHASVELDAGFWTLIRNVVVLKINKEVSLLFKAKNTRFM